ncbi:MAG: Rieske 2Fe-2S domain-containing protein [Actinomycetales bacterium]
MAQRLAVLDRIEGTTSLDPIVEAVRTVTEKLPLSRRLLDVLHGVPLGHPAHPMAVQIPIGAWMSAAFLDLMPGEHRSADALVAVGVVSASPAALSGIADWSRLHPQQQRTGVVHAMANTIALTSYSASLLARLTGHRKAGRRLGFLGLMAVNVGGYLGGHLAYRQAAGANHAEHVPHRVPAGWHAACLLSDLTDGQLAAKEVRGTKVVLLRQGSDVQALADTCSHLSASLAEGRTVTGPDGDTCVECPWHASVFRMEDGAVVHGPATSPQPAFRTRVLNGVVEVELAGADG